MIFGLSLLYWGLWLAILILWMGRFVTSFLSIYLVSALRLDEGVVGTVVAMYGFGAIIGCLFGGTLSDRFGRQSMIIIGEIGAAAALLVVSVLTDPVSLGAALFVYGAFASLPSRPSPRISRMWCLPNVSNVHTYCNRGRLILGTRLDRLWPTSWSRSRIR